MFPRNQIDRCDVAEDDKDLADDGKNQASKIASLEEALAGAIEKFRRRANTAPGAGSSGSCPSGRTSEASS